MEHVPCPTCKEPVAPGSFCSRDGTKAPRINVLCPGFVVDKYNLEEKLGEGGMGEVWRARHQLINRKAAIKFLNPRFITDEAAIARFRREAQAVNEIRHKNLVDVYDFGELSDGRPYFIMEYLEGKRLSEYLSEKGPLAFSQILPILEQICAALGAAHAQGVIHRDLKPGNIFLVLDEEARSPFVKIFDFGIAKLVSAGEEANAITHTGAIFGTPAYMSPEQCEGARRVDHRSDIYALGIILFEMLTGRTPFQLPGEGLGTVMAKHLTTPPPAPSLCVTGRQIPADVDAFLLRVLAKDPGQRPQSAEAFYEELVRVTRSVRHERPEATREARPLLSKDPTQPPDATLVPAEPKQVPRPTRTGDYFVGTPASIISAQPQPAQSRGWKTIGVSALLSVALGSGAVYALFGVPPTREKPETSAAQATLPESETPTAARPAPTAPETPAYVTLTVSSTPRNARVLLGKDELGKTPLETQIPYGEEEVKLQIEHDGYKPQTHTLTPNEARTVDVTLQKLPDRAPAKTKKPTPPKPKETKPTPPKPEDELFIYDPSKKR